MICKGVGDIVRLLQNSESITNTADEDAFEAKNRKNGQFKRWQHDKDKLLKQKQQKQGQQHQSKDDFKLEKDDHQAVASFATRKTLKPTKKVGGGKLTDQLMSRGLLTKKMLTTLHDEWKRPDSGEDSPSAKPR